MRKLDLAITLPDSLAAELGTAAAHSKCSVSQWAAELIESTLAARRLPTVRLGAYGARVIETALNPHPVMAEHRAAAALCAADVPTLDDLDAIADII
jgi:hypothetical protein